MTEVLFPEYLTDLPVPYIQQLSENPVFANELGVFLIDSVGAHVSERNLPLLGENRIITLVFLVHTTDSFQDLGLVFSVPWKTTKIRLRMNQRLRQYTHNFGNSFGHMSKQQRHSRSDHAFAKRNCHPTLRRDHSDSSLTKKHGARMTDL
jgi:hypothetical protein